MVQVKRCSGSFERFWLALRDVENPDEEEFEDSEWYLHFHRHDDGASGETEEVHSQAVVSMVQVTEEFVTPGPVKVTIKRQVESRESLSPQLKQEEKRQRLDSE